MGFGDRQGMYGTEHAVVNAEADARVSWSDLNSIAVAIDEEGWDR
jgi:hypothetical protein